MTTFQRRVNMSTNDGQLFTQAELFAQNNPVDTAFIVTCLCFAMPIIPAVGLGYSGYSTRKNGLASFFPAMIAMAVCSVQCELDWVHWGEADQKGGSWGIR